MQAHRITCNSASSLRLGLILLLFASWVTFAAPAGAFEYEDVPRFEMKAGMSQSAFKQQTQPVQAKPSGMDALAFRMRLPKDWGEVGGVDGFDGGGGLELSSSLLSTVVHYRGPGSLEGQSFFKLKARKLKHIITARKWFMHFILNEGYSLEAIHEISPRKVAVRYTTFKSRTNTSYTVLAIAAINGDQLALAEYYVPTERMNEKRRDHQTLSMRAFELTNKVDTPVEPIETYNFVDIASIDYPASWLIKTSRVRNLDKMNVSLYNTEKDKLERWQNYISRDNFKGRIRIKLIARKKAESIQAEIKEIKKEFQKRDLGTDKLIREIEGINYDRDFDLARTQAYTVHDKSGTYLDFQLWVSVMRSPRYYVFATLFTPDRENAYYNWAVNSEAFKFVLSRLDIK